MTLARSCGLLMPAKVIFVPGANAFGFFSHSPRLCQSQLPPLPDKAGEKAKPFPLPIGSPITSRTQSRSSGPTRDGLKAQSSNAATCRVAVSYRRGARRHQPVRIRSIVGLVPDLAHARPHRQAALLVGRGMSRGWDGLREANRAILTEFESKQVLGAYGIPVSQTVVAADASAAVNVVVR